MMSSPRYRQGRGAVLSRGETVGVNNVESLRRQFKKPVTRTHIHVSATMPPSAASRSGPSSLRAAFRDDSIRDNPGS